MCAENEMDCIVVVAFSTAVLPHRTRIAQTESPGRRPIYDQANKTAANTGNKEADN